MNRLKSIKRFKVCAYVDGQLVLVRHEYEINGVVFATFTFPENNILVLA
jgi:hypothetical protein